MDKYTVATIKKMDTETMTATEIKAKMDEINMHKEMYKNPFWVIALTYMEVLIPIGLLVPIISALILKSKAAVTN